MSLAGTSGDRRLTGVARGTAANDAVNLGQLSAAVAGGVANIPLRGNNTSNLPPPSPTGADALAGGFGSAASGAQSTAYGTSSVASGAQSTAIGQGAQATFAGATAIGAGARAIAGPTTAVGFNATASGNEAAAFGAFATAVGVGATAAQVNAVAIGVGATTTRANQVAIGGAGNTYTLAGLASPASLAAQAGPTRFVTADAGGNLALSDFDPGALARLDGRVGGLDSRLGGLESRVGALEGSVFQLRRDVRRGHEGTAIALAMAGATLPPGKNFALSGNWGTFRGENGFAATGVARLADNVFAHGGVGLGLDRGGVGGRAGVTFAW